MLACLIHLTTYTGGRMMTQDFYSAPADDYFTGYHQYGYTQGNLGYSVATSSG